jgi:hypothetical protein
MAASLLRDLGRLLGGRELPGPQDDFT